MIGAPGSGSGALVRTNYSLADIFPVFPCLQPAGRAS